MNDPTPPAPRSVSDASPAAKGAATNGHRRSALARVGPAVSIAFRVVLGVIFIGVAVGIFAQLVATAPTIEPRTDTDGGPRLVVIDPREVAINRQWTGFGTAEATDRADVPARVTAVVVEVPRTIEAGRAVRAGDLLVRLDDSDFQRQVESSTAAIAELAAQLDRLAIEADAAAERARLAARDLEIAKADEERVRRAAEEQAARQRELDQAVQRSMDAERMLIASREAIDSLAPRRAQLDALRQVQQSLLRRAQDDVERCVIRAPIDGVLQHVDVKPGENVAAGQRVARVVGLSRIEVPLRLASSARREIALGDTVDLFDDGRGDRTWRAEVVRIAPQDDPMTRTMTIYAELVQDPGAVDLLPPGRFVQGSVTAGLPVRRVVVPRRSVRADRLLVVREGVVRSVEIAVDFPVEQSFPESGLDDTLWLALRDAPALGDLVIVDAGRNAVPGQTVVAVFPNGREAHVDARRPEPTTP